MPPLLRPSLVAAGAWRIDSTLARTRLLAQRAGINCRSGAVELDKRIDDRNGVVGHSVLEIFGLERFDSCFQAGSDHEAIPMRQTIPIAQFE